MEVKKIFIWTTGLEHIVVVDSDIEGARAQVLNHMKHTCDKSALAIITNYLQNTQPEIKTTSLIKIPL